jgi:PadR family transcriptional regulator, regulatory protein PadR
VAPDPDKGETKRSIERELKRGAIELAVLHVLSWGEAYGYEIVTKLVDQSDGALAITDGTLYPVLYRLEAAGLVDVRWETLKRGVPRKYYQLTRAGRAELARQTTEWTAFTTAMNRLLRQQSEIK